LPELLFVVWIEFCIRVYIELLNYSDLTREKSNFFGFSLSMACNMLIQDFESVCFIVVFLLFLGENVCFFVLIRFLHYLN